MRGFFDALSYFFQEILLMPFNALARLELSNWWLANTPVWIMIFVLFVLLFYWVKQLSVYKKQGTERVDVTAHSFFK